MRSKRYYRHAHGNFHVHVHVHLQLNYNMHYDCDFGFRWRSLDGIVGGVVALSLLSFDCGSVFFMQHQFVYIFGWS